MFFVLDSEFLGLIRVDDHPLTADDLQRAQLHSATIITETCIAEKEERWVASLLKKISPELLVDLAFGLSNGVLRHSNLVQKV